MVVSPLIPPKIYDRPHLFTGVLAIHIPAIGGPNFCALFNWVVLLSYIMYLCILQTTPMVFSAIKVTICSFSLVSFLILSLCFIKSLSTALITVATSGYADTLTA